MVFDGEEITSRAHARAEDLSLPDRQLVEPPKCLATRPKIVLLDEIMGGLNRAECDVPVEAITLLRADRITFLLVAAAALAYRVLPAHDPGRRERGRRGRRRRRPVQDDRAGA